MTRPFILPGNKTDRGGMTITASDNTNTSGKDIACMGGKVTCPRKGHGGTTMILTNDLNVIINDKQAARHSDKTACGATLLLSQDNTDNI